MDCLPAPLSVLELLACTSSRKCEAQTCPCITNQLKCTDICKLPSCANRNVTVKNDDSHQQHHHDMLDCDSDSDSDSEDI